MLARVPRRRESWSGTGTVIVVTVERFCMIWWLPRWRTAKTSAPERTRSLPNHYLDLSYENIVVRAPGDLRWGCGLKEQSQRLNQIGAGLFNRFPLTRDIEFRAQRYKTIVLSLNDSRQSLR